MATQQGSIPATLIPGDGIGPEISAAVVEILAALGAPFEWETQEGGMAAAEKSGDPLPPALLESIRRTKLALKGPLTTPVGGGFRSVNVRLREAFGLYANLRPARTIIPGGRYDDIDIVLVRENLEGLYVAFEHYIPIGGDAHAVAISSGVNTRAGSRRIAEFAFDYAVKHGRKKVTIVHKANVLKALTGIFLEAAKDVAKKYEGRVQADDRIVDACAMQLVLNPWQFDVIVTTNLFGDILSDEIAGLIGGLGMAPGANIGEGAAIFEAVHGSAPDIAGKGIANPLAMLFAAALMLEHVNRVDLAQRLRAAVDATLREDKVRTGDLGGKASTKELTQAIVAARAQLSTSVTQSRLRVRSRLQRRINASHEISRTVREVPGERGRRVHVRGAGRGEHRRHGCAAGQPHHVRHHAPRAGRRVHGRRLRPARPGAPACACRRSGPGATNLITGVADANMDRAPMVAIAGPGRDHPHAQGKPPDPRSGEPVPADHQVRRPDPRAGDHRRDRAQGLQGRADREAGRPLHRLPGEHRRDERRQDADRGADGLHPGPAARPRSRRQRTIISRREVSGDPGRQRRRSAQGAADALVDVRRSAAHPGGEHFHGQRARSRSRTRCRWARSA